MYYDFKTAKDQAVLDKGEYRTNLPLSRAGSSHQAARRKSLSEESDLPAQQFKEDVDAAGVPKDDQNIKFNPTQSKAQGFGQEGDKKVPTFDARRVQIEDQKSNTSNTSPEVVSVKNARQEALKKKQTRILKKKTMKAKA